MSSESSWKTRFEKAIRYTGRGDWGGLKTEIREFVLWKFLSLWRLSVVSRKPHRLGAQLRRLSARLRRLIAPLPRQAWQNLYERPVSDLGDVVGERLRGIYSPLYERSLVGQYITSQFVEFAQTYRDKYQDTRYSRTLIAAAFRKMGLRSTRGLKILDIGSGAGNSVIPLLDLCPDSLVIASDLSVELLALLKMALADRGETGNCVLLQLNAEELDFRPESFDLIVGAAVLHHLFAPEETLKGCAKILKRGGRAVFFEPFENGNIILRIIYKSILNDPRKETLPPEASRVLQAMIRDYDVRIGRDKSQPIFRELDDKWLFTPKYFREFAERYGFSKCMIYPLHSTDTPFANQTATTLQMVLGESGQEALPDWAWEIVKQYDHLFSDDMKTDLLIEGCVILEK
jgi:ubiquinone/menaquinone biosynthesis C-methylase UbiE